MKRAMILFLVSGTIMLLLSSCNSACVCDVTWREIYSVGLDGDYPNNIIRVNNHAEYVVYPDSYESTCEKALGEEYHINEYNENIVKIHCVSQ